jgi:hypothetical protein
MPKEHHFKFSRTGQTSKEPHSVKFFKTDTNDELTELIEKHSKETGAHEASRITEEEYAKYLTERGDTDRVNVDE